MDFNQSDIFLKSEGNRWFERNQRYLKKTALKHDLPLLLLQLYHLKPKSALEVGAANGYRLEALHRLYKCKVTGVEPSDLAINDAKRHFPFVKMVKGLAHDFAVSGTFDLVIAYFVFHWIDRALLLASVAALDRCLADGGYLILGDFSPDGRLKTKYHHLPRKRVFTYKQDYASLFLSSGIYSQIAVLTGDHTSKKLTGEVAAKDKIGCWLLRKKGGKINE